MRPPGDRPWRVVVDGREVTEAEPVDEVAAEVVEDGPGTRLRVTGRGRLDLVELAPWDGPAAGLGQPVFGDGWFAALEHPGAEGFALALDVDLAAAGTAGYESPLFVVGRCERGRELSALWDELDRVRARPPRLVTLANNWYQLGYAGKMSQETVRAERAGFAAIAGLDLDFYCLDDPWDGEYEAATGLWGRMAPGRFPGGLAALGERIGLWVSPFCGYFDRHEQRVEWGRAHGFEVDDDEWPKLCPAGDRYRTHLAESLARFTTAGVGYWKIDGVQFDCGSGAAHSHGDRTDQMDRFAALLDGVRAVNPATVLTFTTGSNPSPWWLKHADFIWRGGLDDDAPAELDGGRHERFATYIDMCLDAFRGSGVPVSAVVTFSVVENAVRAYGQEEDEGPEAWERHCWFLVGRGTHHHDLYVAPDSLSRTEWAALTRALAWARAHQAVLARSRMVGGRPQAGEAYGFVSEANGRAIVCLRNPSQRVQAIEVEVDMADPEPVWGALPRFEGGTITADLEPFEVVLVSGRGRPSGRQPPPGDVAS